MKNVSLFPSTAVATVLKIDYWRGHVQFTELMINATKFVCGFEIRYFDLNMFYVLVCAAENVKEAIETLKKNSSNE